MIKKRKYKAFSLIEVMVLFTALSFMFLAFLPMMLKRPQKVTESDCVGGLRSVRQEYNVGENQSFRVPDEIASNVTVTLVGAGASGGGSSGQRGVTSYSFYVRGGTISSCLSSNIVVNCFISSISRGNSTKCASPGSGTGRVQAGSSGRYIPKAHVLSADGTFSTNLSNASEFGPIEGDFDDFTPAQRGEKLVLSGGMIPLIFDGFDKNTIGNGQGCRRGNTAADYSRLGDAGKSNVEIRSYVIPTAGQGGASGAYARFPLALANRTDCSITVGRGGTPGADSQAGGNTSITCDGETYEAQGGQRDKGGVASANIPENMKRDGVDPNGARRLSYGPFVSYNNLSIAGDGADSYLAKGGRRACEGENLTTCQNSNGSNGMLGSGGGGGAYTESSQGMGGRGGDGLAVVEYLEYCK